MTPADRRIKELIDKWLASVDLHLQYVELSDSDYARVQPWPRHDRPTRWVLEVARQKILELQALADSRRDMADGKFAESLELMAFLANLVGIQHIQRFIPLASAPGGAEDAPSSRPTREADMPKRSAAPEARHPANDDSTREMPALARAGALRATAPPVRDEQQDEPTGKASTQDLPVRHGRSRSGSARTTAAALHADAKDRIIIDAVRLLKWGRSWHELAELISRIADRPSIGEVRKVLRANKTAIEEQAAAR